MKKHFLSSVAIMLIVVAGCKKMDSPVESAKELAVAAPALPILPALPTAPTVPSLVYSVATYGALPNDGIDDRASIQNAIDALLTAGGGTLEFAAGTYNLTINPASGAYKNAITMGTGKIRLAPQAGAVTTIKLNDNQGAYYCIFNAQNTADVSIEKLRFDQNGLNNQIALSEISGGDGGSVLQPSVRQIFAFSGASRFKVDQCTFDNVLGVWVIFNSSGSDGTITNNICQNVGGSTYDYDVSVFYTDCSRALVSGNSVSGRSIGAKGARTAFEIHGSDQTVTGNTINAMLVGINIVGGMSGATSANRQSYTNNVMNNVYNGFELWTYVPLNDVSVENNQININVDKFFYAGLPAFAAGKYAPSFGIGIKDWAKAVNNFKISNNTITFTNFSRVLQEPEFSASTYCAGISFATTNSTSIAINNLTVTQNTVNNPLSAGFYSFISINNALVSGNTFNNPGQASVYSGAARYTDQYWDAFSTYHQSGVYSWSKQTAKVKSFVISNNITNDTVIPDLVKYGAVGIAKTTDVNCSLSGNTVTGASAAVAQVKGSGWK